MSADDVISLMWISLIKQLWKSFHRLCQKQQKQKGVTSCLVFVQISQTISFFFLCLWSNLQKSWIKKKKTVKESPTDTSARPSLNQWNISFTIGLERSIGRTLREEQTVGPSGSQPGVNSDPGLTYHNSLTSTWIQMLLRLRRVRPDWSDLTGLTGRRPENKESPVFVFWSVEFHSDYKWDISYLYQYYMKTNILMIHLFFKSSGQTLRT